MVESNDIAPLVDPGGCRIQGPRHVDHFEYSIAQQKAVLYGVVAVLEAPYDVTLPVDA